MRITMVLATALLTGGCAHVLEIVDNQSIGTSKLKVETGKSDTRIITIDGPRRLVRSSYDDRGVWSMCAETQADAIAARSARADLEIVDRAKLGDSVQEVLTVTNNRTELNDTVRQLSWQICNNRADGFITPDTAERLFAELVTASMQTLQMRAGVDLAAYQKVKHDVEVITDKLKKYQDCVIKSERDKAKIAACPT